MSADTSVHTPPARATSPTVSHTYWHTKVHFRPVRIQAVAKPAWAGFCFASYSVMFDPKIHIKTQVSPGKHPNSHLCGLHMKSASDEISLRSPIEPGSRKSALIPPFLRYPPLVATPSIICHLQSHPSSSYPFDCPLPTIFNPVSPYFRCHVLYGDDWGGGASLVPTVAPIVQQQQNSYLHLCYLFFLGLKMAASDGDTSVWPPKTRKSPCLSTSLTRVIHVGELFTW